MVPSEVLNLYVCLNCCLGVLSCAVSYVSGGLAKYDLLVEIASYVGVIVTRLWLHVSGSASMRIISLYMALYFVFCFFTCWWMLRTGFRTLMCVVCDGLRVWPMLVYE